MKFINLPYLLIYQILIYRVYGLVLRVLIWFKLRRKVYFARTGWLAIALLPTPIALFLLASSGAASALQAGTALIGLSSGFIFAAAVSITSELLDQTVLELTTTS